MMISDFEPFTLFGEHPTLYIVYGVAEKAGRNI
jgi:hypothetical protein